MSESTNTQLIERAMELSEEYAGTWLPRAIDNLIKRNELEQLEYMVTQAEANLAREDYYDNDTY